MQLKCECPVCFGEYQFPFDNTKPHGHYIWTFCFHCGEPLLMKVGIDSTPKVPNDVEWSIISHSFKQEYKRRICSLAGGIGNSAFGTLNPDEPPTWE